MEMSGDLDYELLNSWQQEMVSQWLLEILGGTAIITTLCFFLRLGCLTGRKTVDQEYNREGKHQTRHAAMTPGGQSLHMEQIPQ